MEADGLLRWKWAAIDLAARVPDRVTNENEYGAGDSFGA